MAWLSSLLYKMFSGVTSITLCKILAKIAIPIAIPKLRDKACNADAKAAFSIGTDPITIKVLGAENNPKPKPAKNCAIKITYKGVVLSIKIKIKIARSKIIIPTAHNQLGSYFLTKLPAFGDTKVCTNGCTSKIKPVIVAEYPMIICKYIANNKAMVKFDI